MKKWTKEQKYRGRSWKNELRNRNTGKELKNWTKEQKAQGKEVEKKELRNVGVNWKKLKNKIKIVNLRITDSDNNL